jgi:hypothetical protein
MRITIRDFMKEYEEGAFEDKSLETMCKAGWHDWFCDESQLKNRLGKLYPKIKEIVRSKKIDIDAMFVRFENCCPGVGSLYDEFRICDMETGDVIYAVTPRSGHTDDKGRAELWGRENEFNGPIVTGMWETITAHFGV